MIMNKFFSTFGVISLLLLTFVYMVCIILQPVLRTAYCKSCSESGGKLLHAESTLPPQPLLLKALEGPAHVRVRVQVGVHVTGFGAKYRGLITGARGTIIYRLRSA